MFPVGCWYLGNPDGLYFNRSIPWISNGNRGFQNREWEDELKKRARGYGFAQGLGVFSALLQMGQ